MSHNYSMFSVIKNIVSEMAETPERIKQISQEVNAKETERLEKLLVSLQYCKNSVE